MSIVTGDLDLDLTIVEEVPSGGDASIPEDALEALAVSVLAAEGQAGAWEVALVFVSDARLQRMHLDFMGIDEPTDVMTFEREPDDGEPGSSASGGDVIISVDRAAEQSREHGNAPDREVLFLVVHGLLHLFGWTDGSDEDRTAMLARGDELLSAFSARAG